MGGHEFVRLFYTLTSVVQFSQGFMHVCVCVLTFSDHGITRGGVYLVHTLPFRVGVQTRKKKTPQTPRFLLICESLIQM